MRSTISFTLYDQNGLRKYINPKEAKRLLDNIYKCQPKKRLFFLMLYFTGARISEAIQINPRHIDFSQKSISLLCLKKRRKGVYRQIPLPDQYIKELNTFLNEMNIANSNECIWWPKRTASRYVSQLMKASAIEGPQACSRGLRHHFGVNAILNNVPLTLIQKWMGHASITTTAIYLQVIGAEERQIAKKMW